MVAFAVLMKFMGERLLLHDEDELLLGAVSWASTFRSLFHRPWIILPALHLRRTCRCDKQRMRSPWLDPIITQSGGFSCPIFHCSRAASEHWTRISGKSMRCMALVSLDLYDFSTCTTFEVRIACVGCSTSLGLRVAYWNVRV